MKLDDPVRTIDPRLANRRMGARTKGPPAYEVLDDALGIETVGQLLRHYPRRYIDRSKTVAIRQLRIGQEATVIGRVKRVLTRRTRQGRPMVTVTLFDGSGYLDLTFFNQPWVANTYREGVELAVSGVGATYRGHLQLANQLVEVLRSEEAEQVHTGRIIPVHRAAEGISARTIREMVHRALERLPHIPEPLPAEV
ncbi:MAG TPA: OB-fold nucleic acid binding domain-containing protein, partial [Actinomycetota bacterium]